VTSPKYVFTEALECLLKLLMFRHGEKCTTGSWRLFCGGIKI